MDCTGSKTSMLVLSGCIQSVHNKSCHCKHKNVIFISNSIIYISLCFTSIVCRDWLICIMCKQMKRSSSTCCSCWCVQCNDYQQTQIWEISYCTHHICRTGVCSATKMALTLEDWLYMPNWCSTTNRNTLVQASFPPCGKRDPGHLIRLNYNSAMTSRLTYLLPM